MRICLVSQEYPPQSGGGGIGTQTWLKAQGLTRRGHTVHVVSASWDDKSRCLLDGEAVIHRVAETKLNVPGFEPSTYWLHHSIAVAEKINELSEEIAFDLIQFPEYGGEGFVYQTDTFAHRTAKYIVQMHGPLAMFVEHMGWPDRGSTLDQIGCFMERSVLHHCDGLMASSRNTAAFCASRYGLDLDRIRVVHSGIDTDYFKPVPSLGSDEDNGPFPKILFVGNLVGNKGFHLLVDAAIRLLPRYPRLQLRTIGKGDNDSIRDAADRVVAAKAEENVEFLGYVPHRDLPKYFAWCDLFAGPSIFEPGPGNVYLEAMACGRPVIACGTGGTPEVVLDRKTGLLISPDNIDALAEAICTLSDQPDLRAQFGEAGRAWTTANFGIERYIDNVERFYEAILSDDRGRQSGGKNA